MEELTISYGGPHDAAMEQNIALQIKLEELNQGAGKHTDDLVDELQRNAAGLTAVAAA